MAKKTTYQEMNRIINSLCSYNAMCFRSLEQTRKTSFEKNVSSVTAEWLSSKHKAFASGRMNYIYDVYLKVFGEEELKSKFGLPAIYYLKEIKKNGSKVNIEKPAIVKCDEKIAELEKEICTGYLKVFPKSNKTFNQLINDDAAIIDKEFAKIITDCNDLLNKGVKKQNIPNIELLDSYNLYCSFFRSKFVIIDSMKIFDFYKEDLTSDGMAHLYTFKNESPEIKQLSFDILVELKYSIDKIVKQIPKQKIQQGIVVNKLLKQLKKQPDNQELINSYNEENNAYSVYDERISDANILKIYVDAFCNRFDASNTPKTGISDAITETLLDLSFGVSGDYKKLCEPKYNETVYVSNSEVDSVISLLVNFPDLVDLMQQLCFETKNVKEFELVDLNYSKYIIGVLQEIHKDKVEFNKQNNPNATDEQLRVMSTNPEIAKYLVFKTPLGKVWCNGENCINCETNEVVKLEDLEKYFYNEEDGCIYMLKPEQPEQTKDVKTKNVTDESSEQSDSVSETPSAPVSGRKK